MLDRAVIEKIRAYFASCRDEMLRDLFRLVRIPSIKSAATPDAPFGAACRDGLLEAIALFRENGFDADAFSGNKYGLAKYGSGSPVICLFGHTDVVPVGDGWDYTAPFEPIVRDGCVIGRGCGDDKAGVITSLYLLRAFRDLGLPCKGTLQVFLGAAEETGMEDIKAFTEEQPMPDVSIVPDGEYPVSLGEKGICHLFVSSGSRLTDLIDFRGGFAKNVVLDHAEVAFRADSALAREVEAAAAGKPAFAVKRENDRTVLTATGVTAHASIPENSVNAAKLACDLLLSLSTLGEGDRRILSGAADLLSGVHGEPFGLEHDDPYFGPVTAANGIVRVENGRLVLSFDIRYGSSVPAALVEKQIKLTLARVGYELSGIYNEEGFRLPEDLPACRSMVETYRLVMGDSSLEPIYMGGGTYARHLKNAFSIGTMLPGYPLFPMREGHGGWHQPDEALNVEGFVGSTLMATCMAYSLMETL